MKNLLTLLLLCGSVFYVNAQCEPTESCETAPLVCGQILHGYQGITLPPSVPPPLIPTFFCGEIDNPQWFAFVPCEPNVTFDIVVENCSFPASDGGLQAAVLQVDDCSFPLVINCVEQIMTNTTGQISAVGLEPGQIYHLLVDGWSGDICNFQILVNQGVNIEDPDYEQIEEGYIEGPTSLPCGGGLQEYIAHVPVCQSQNINACSPTGPVAPEDCTLFEWTLPPGAVIIGDDTGATVQIDFSDAVSGELSVETSWNEEECGDADCFCETCDTDPIPPIFITIDQPNTVILPPLVLCEGEVFQFCGDNYTATSDDDLSCQNGCDVMLQNITVLPGAQANILQIGDLEAGSVVILENEFFDAASGETYFWSGPGISDPTNFNQGVTQPGVYAVTVTNPAGCTATDQTVVLPGPICDEENTPVPPSDSCFNAPPFCESYLNGYCSVNAFNTADTPGDLQSVLSCQIENNQWLSFVVCESEATLEIAVSNCLGGQGLEISVLQSPDCQSFNAVADCQAFADDDMAEIMMSGLVPGQEYLLMVDGIGGDICQWEVVASSGVSAGVVLQEDNTPGFVTGPEAACVSEDPGPFSFDFVPAICNLELVGGCPASQLFCEPHLDTCISYRVDTIWRIEPAGILQFVDGDSMGAPVEIYLPDTVFLLPGTVMDFTIYPTFPLTPIDTNECEASCFGACEVILADNEPCAITPGNFTICTPDTDYQFQVICPGECVNFYGEVFCGGGVYTVSEFDVCGCESIYTLELIEIFNPPPIYSGPDILCSADGQTYTVSFEIQDFTGTFFTTVNGQPVFDSYESAPILSGSPYDFFIESFDQCGFGYSESFSGTHECDCTPQTFDLGLTILCPGDCFPVNANDYCDEGVYDETIFNPDTGCDDQYLFELMVADEPPLSVGPVSEVCNAVNSEYTVTFSINGGVEPYFVNGAPISGSLYQSAPIASGDSYLFEITDAGLCGLGQDFIQGQFTCTCFTDPGTMSLGTMPVCENLAATGEWNADATLDANDALVFVLHTGSGNSLGNILATNATGTFSFDPGSMAYEQTYYISAVAGDAMGNSVDFNSACLAVSPGQPVLFYEMPQLDLLPTTEITCTETSAPLSAVPSGGSGDFTITWSGPGLNASGPSASATQAGVFTCELTDNVSGCVVENSIVVTADEDLPVFQITPPNEPLTCAVTALTIGTSSSQNDLVYTWTLPGGGSAAGPDILAAEAGGYSVTATAQNGCTATDGTSVDADFSEPEGVFANATEITCINPEASLEAFTSTSGVNFEWLSPSGNLLTGQNITTDEPGTFTLTATGGNGCTTETSTDVIEDLLPPANVQATDDEINCAETIANLSVTSATPNVSFEWTSPQGNPFAGPNISTDEAGAYSITATGGNGCTTEIFTNVSEDILPPANVQATGGTITCTDLSASLSATSATPGVSFAWLSPSGNTFSGANVSTDEAGIYAITATGGNGCISETTAEVSEDILPPADVVATSAEVNCDEPAATLEVTSSTPNTVFDWVFPTGNESTGPSIVTDIGGQYTITATGPNGCTTETTTEVVNSSEPPEDLEVNNAGVTCNDPIATLEASSSTAGTTFMWAYPNGTAETGQVIETELPGEYTVIATAPNGCTDEILATVVDFSQPPADLTASGGEINCDQPTLTLAGSSSTFGVAYTWLFPGGVPMEGQNVPTGQAGNYTLVVTGPNGCTASATVQVTGDVEVPSVMVNDGEVSCIQPEVILSATSNMPDALFSWVFPDGIETTGPAISASLSGDYMLTVKAPNGCDTTVVAEVMALPDPEILPTVLIEPPTCAGDVDAAFMVTDFFGGNAPYSLTVNGQPIMDEMVENIPSGNYDLVITDVFGCTDEQLIEIPEPEVLEINLGEDVFTILGEEVELNLETNVAPANIEWSGPDGQMWTGVSSLVVQPMGTGTYRVVVTDPNGCTEQAQVQLFVKEGGTVYIPNAFSPNGDEVNDLFTVFAGNDVALVRSLTIFNRWGNKVFVGENFPPEASNEAPTFGWDGKLDGENLDAAVFAFMAEVEFITGEVKVFTGDVTLVR